MQRIIPLFGGLFVSTIAKNVEMTEASLVRTWRNTVSTSLLLLICWMLVELKPEVRSASAVRVSRQLRASRPGAMAPSVRSRFGLAKRYDDWIWILGRASRTFQRAVTQLQRTLSFLVDSTTINVTL